MTDARSLSGRDHLIGALLGIGYVLLLAKTAGGNRAISWDPSVTTGVRLPRLQLDDIKS